jgi:WD domain, G-beta repeat
MYRQNSEQEGGPIYGAGGMDAHHFSRRVMLGGLTGLVGVGVAGCSLPFGPTQATPTARVLPTATHIPPSPTPSPTPTAAPLGTTLYTYQGHSNRVNTAVWAPDGKRIASGSVDTTVQIWDALSGKLSYTYTGHNATVYAAVWSPNGTYIASGGDDKTVQVWQAV